jgi:hypothetical protein
LPLCDDASKTFVVAFNAQGESLQRQFDSRLRRGATFDADSTADGYTPAECHANGHSHADEYSDAKRDSN